MGARIYNFWRGPSTLIQVDRPFLTPFRLYLSQMIAHFQSKMLKRHQRTFHFRPLRPSRTVHFNSNESSSFDPFKRYFSRIINHFQKIKSWAPPVQMTFHFRFSRPDNKTGQFSSFGPTTFYNVHFRKPSRR